MAETKDPTSQSTELTESELEKIAGGKGWRSPTLSSDIKGDSKDSEHKDWIEVETFSPGTRTLGSPQPSAKSTTQGCTLTEWKLRRT